MKFCFVDLLYFLELNILSSEDTKTRGNVKDFLPKE